MNIAVIPAGGIGTRMGFGDIPKQFLELNDMPVIIHVLKQFDNCREIDAIVIACSDEWTGYLERLIAQYHIKKFVKIVQSGKTNQLSIYRGLLGAKEIAKDEQSVVLIHDAVRPLIDSSIIRMNIESVHTYGSAITVSNANETVITVDDDNEISSVPNKNKCKIARAPQSFWLDDLLNVYQTAIRDWKFDFADSCTLMQYYHKPLHLIEGPDENIKITTKSDFFAVEGILDGYSQSQHYCTSL